MNYTINQITDYYAKASIEYVNIVTNQTLPNEIDGGRTTAHGLSGIVIPLSGCAFFTINNTTYKLNDGMMILHAGSQMDLEVETIGDKTWKYAVIHYKTLQAAPIDLKNKDFAIRVKQISRIKEYVKQLMKYASEPGSFAIFQVKVTFYNLLNEIIVQAKKYFDENNPSVIPKAIAFMHENYVLDFSIAELAELLQMERRRFSELFEQHTGLTPIQYLTEYRILKACEMLRVGEYSIAEIAELVGYQDNFYFSRVFKKKVGMSPSKYRKYIVENYI